VCLSLFNGLEKAGVASTLISGTKGALVSQVAHNTHTILLPSMKREIGLKSLWHELKNFFVLYKTLRAIKRNNPHVIVHTHSTKAGIIGRWAALCAGIKTRIHTIHGYAFHRYQPWPQWLAIYMIELITSFITTHYICVSSADAKTGIQLFPWFASKHSIIRAAVDDTFYHPSTPTIVTSKPFIFGTISCFKPQKNIFDLLHAFEHVHSHNNQTHLEIIGDGALRDEITTWIERHNLTHAITLHGWQSNVAPLMMQWHAFVLSSLWEGLPCAIVEARLLHLPVIAYDTGGIHDVIEHYKNGILIPPKQWQLLAKTMLDLTQQTNLHHALQHHHDDLSDFSTAKMVQEHIRLYERQVSI
jgi:Glycosyltransferase